MIFKKPEYPKALEAYSITMLGDSLTMREVVKSKIGEESFIRRYSDKKIEIGKLKSEDLKDVPFLTIVMIYSPKCLFPVSVIAWTIFIAWITKILTECQQ